MIININAQKKYQVVLDSYSNLKTYLKNLVKGEKILIVTDTVVEKLYLAELKENLQGYNLFTYSVPNGEQSKNIENYIKILTYLAENNFHRDDTIIALGGGVIGDLAGFVSATYMRGITLIQCPTTLLSAVDSSVGGKTAIDLPQGKNLVGAFYQPSLTFIDEKVFSTLPKREIDCGMGEIIKYAFLSTTVTEDMLKQGVTKRLVKACVEIKAKIVEEDEFDNGKRALLNLGHTIGHAIETLAGLTLSHGECVVKGVNAVIKMSQKYYNLPKERVEKLNALLNYSNCNLAQQFTNDQILAQIEHDKKSVTGGVNLLLIYDIGDVRIEKLTKTQVKELME